MHYPTKTRILTVFQVIPVFHLAYQLLFGWVDNLIVLGRFRKDTGTQTKLNHHFVKLQNETSE